MAACWRLSMRIERRMQQIFVLKRMDPRRAVMRKKYSARIAMSIRRPLSCVKRKNFAAALAKMNRHANESELAKSFDTAVQA